MLFSPSDSRMPTPALTRATSVNAPLRVSNAVPHGPGFRVDCRITCVEDLAGEIGAQGGVGPGHVLYNLPFSRLARIRTGSVLRTGNGWWRV
jgi:hypothetical protein